MPDIDKLALIVSRGPILVSNIETALAASGSRTAAAGSGQALWAAFGASPPVDLILIDGELKPPEIGRDTELAQQEPAIPADPLVLMADGGFGRWKRCMAEGLLHDLIPRDRRNLGWRLRLELALCRAGEKRDADRSQDAKHG